MAQNKFWPGVSIDPEKDGSIQKIDGSNLEVGDGAIVITSDASYMYVLDDSGDDSNPPDVLEPTQNSESKRWKLVSMTGGSEEEDGASIDEPPDDGMSYTRMNGEWFSVGVEKLLLVGSDSDTESYYFFDQDTLATERISSIDFQIKSVVRIGEFLFCGTGKPSLAKVRATTGEVVAEIDTQYATEFKQLIVGEDGYIYYPASYTEVLKVDPEDLSVLGSLESPDGNLLSVVWIDGVLYISECNTVYKIDPESMTWIDEDGVTLEDVGDYEYPCLRYYKDLNILVVKAAWTEYISFHDPETLELLESDDGTKQKRTFDEYEIDYDISDDGDWLFVSEALEDEEEAVVYKIGMEDITQEPEATYTFEDSNTFTRIFFLIFYRDYIYLAVDGEGCFVRKLDSSDMSVVESVDLENYFETKDGMIVGLPLKSFVTDASTDGKHYARREGGWSSIPASVVEKAPPEDGKYYAQKEGGWSSFDSEIFPPYDGNIYARGYNEWVKVPDMKMDVFLYVGVASVDEVLKIDAETMSIAEDDNGDQLIFDDPTNNVEDVVFDHKNNCIFVASSDEYVYKIDAKTMKVMQDDGDDLKFTDDKAMRHLAYDSEEKILYVANYHGDHNYIHKLDAKTMSEISKLTSLGGDNVYSIGLGPDGFLYAGVRNNGTLRIDTDDMTTVKDSDDNDVKYSSDAATEIVFDSDGYMYLAYTSGEVHKVNLDDLTLAQDGNGDDLIYTGLAGNISALTIDSDGYLYAGDKSDIEIHKIDTETMEIVKDGDDNDVKNTSFSSEILSLVIDFFGYVYAGDGDGNIKKLDKETLDIVKDEDDNDLVWEHSDGPDIESIDFGHV